jgi:acyl dehydratase
MGYYYEDFEPEQTIVTRGRTVGEGDITTFAGLSGDFNPLHVDAEFSASAGYKGRIAHGPMTLAMAIGLMSQQNLIDGTTTGLLGLNWAFSAPVTIGDTIHARVTLASKRPTRDAARGIVVLRLDVRNQHDKSVQLGEMTLMMLRRTGRPAA